MDKDKHGSIICLLVLIVFPNVLLIGPNYINSSTEKNLGDLNYSKCASLGNPHSSSPQQEFDIIDLRGMGLTFDEQLLISSIEGIVNQNQSKVYFMYSEVGELWLEYINSTEYQGSITSCDNVSQIIDLYADYFDGLIVLNSSSYDEVNLASPLAGVYDALLVSHSLYNELSPSSLSSFPILKNITADLNGKSNRVERYEYAIEDYYPLCNQSAFAIYAGDIAMHMRSFLIANNLFTFWRVLYVYTEVPLEWGAPALDPDPEEELALFETFLNNTPGNIPIYGFCFPDGSNEGETIRRISENNKYLIAADFFENLPFFHHMILPEGYEFNQYRPETYPNLENKIYVTGIWSDGDNIQYVYNYMRPQLWDGITNTHGEVPTGWTINPSLIDLAPYIMKFYYENATQNDYFIGALSGKGYCKMDFYSNTTIREIFLRESQTYWDSADLREARIWALDESAEDVTSIIDLESIFDGYLGSLHHEDPRVVNGIPIIKSMGVSREIESAFNYLKRMNRINPIRPKFIFLHLHCWLTTTEMWTELAQKIQALDGVELVRPDELSALMKQWDGHGNKYVVYGVGSVIILGIVGLISIGIKKYLTRKNQNHQPEGKSLNKK